MSGELKPCAHCGSDYEVEEWRHADWTEWRVMCGRCGASTDWYSSLDAAIAAWNTRADDAQVIENAENYNLADDSRPQVIAIGEKYKSDDKPDSRERLEADIKKYRWEHGETSGRVTEWLDRQAAISEHERDEYWQHIAAGNELLEADKCALQDQVDSLTAELCRERKSREYAYNELNKMLALDGKRVKQINELTAERDELDEMRERYARALNQIADALGVEITDDAETHAREMAAIDKLTAERDELRKERDRWHVEQVHAYGNWEDVHEYAKKLEAERDELHNKLADALEQVDNLTAELKHKQNVCDVQRESFLKMERECAELRRMLADAAEAI